MQKVIFGPYVYEISVGFVPVYHVSVDFGPVYTHVVQELRQRELLDYSRE